MVSKNIVYAHHCYMQHCMKLLHVWPKIYMYHFFSIHVSTEYMQTIRFDYLEFIVLFPCVKLYTLNPEKVLLYWPVYLKLRQRPDLQVSLS